MNKQVSVSTHCRVSFSLVLTFIFIITNIGESCKRYLPPFVAALAVSVSAFKRLKVCMKKINKYFLSCPKFYLLQNVMKRIQRYIHWFLNFHYLSMTHWPDWSHSSFVEQSKAKDGVASLCSVLQLHHLSTDHKCCLAEEGFEWWSETREGKMTTHLRSKTLH